MKFCFSLIRCLVKNESLAFFQNLFPRTLLGQNMHLLLFAILSSMERNISRKAFLLVKVNSAYMKHKVWPRQPCCTVKVDPAWKFKYTTAARDLQTTMFKKTLVQIEISEVEARKLLGKIRYDVCQKTFLKLWIKISKNISIIFSL